MTPLDAKTLPSCENTASEIRTIKDVYKCPKKKDVSEEIYEVCQYILDQNIAVSELNIRYTGHCIPDDKQYRHSLKRQHHRGIFGKYFEEQDLLLLRRFRELINLGVVKNA